MQGLSARTDLHQCPSAGIVSSFVLFAVDFLIWTLTLSDILGNSRTPIRPRGGHLRDSVETQRVRDKSNKSYLDSRKWLMEKGLTLVSVYRRA